ncbi:AMP-binding protein, partial [Fulvivirga kasyanovii]|uniref:AMP-binding protein n=1 Tax=Fulvivirga kasyanovii TaxID=396812 RepID=UPI0031D6925A
TPVSGREHHDLEGQIGFYVNTLALRTRFSGEGSFKSLLDQVKETTLEGYNHQVYPFDRLVDELDLSRDMSRSPLFDVMVSYHGAGGSGIGEGEQAKGLSGIEVSSYGSESTISKFDLSFTFVEGGSDLYVNIEYDTHLFSAERIDRMLGHLNRLLSSASASIEEPLYQLSYLTEEEQRQLESFNDTVMAYPQERFIPDMFEEQAALYPDAPCVLFEETTLSYREINERANRLAHYLQVEQKATTGMCIGLMVSRTAEMLVNILGILKSGAAYIPVDPFYPADRINYIIENSELSLILTESDYLDRIGSVSPLLTEALDLSGYSPENPGHRHKASDLFYVIYTSGSTGRPKGVMVNHGNTSSLIHWAQSEFDASSFEVMYAATSYCFDLSMYEFF